MVGAATSAAGASSACWLGYEVGLRGGESSDRQTGSIGQWQYSGRRGGGRGVGRRRCKWGLREVQGVKNGGGGGCRPYR